jgi:diketogulonate reductase-like aldo/keto reductase
LEPNAETVAFSVKNNITVEAYSPLGRSGHSGDIPHNSVIMAVAAAHGVSTYQVALKWILQHGHILTFQSSSQKHQAEDADLFGFNLTDEEMATLDKQALADDSLSPVVV